MKVLITGANGQIGWELVRRASADGIDAIALAAPELDITDAKAVRDTVMGSGAHVLINAAAYTAVDKAEQEREQAFAVNSAGPGHLASACARARIPLLHLSTDYVFDGTKSGSYREDDPVAPLGVYGDSKWRGEVAVRERCPAHIVLRTSWVFGSHGHNFVKTVLRLARERDELRIVADQKGCPTFAGAIADCLLKLAERVAFSADSAWGTYHYCGTPDTTWHGFANAIVEQAARYERLAVGAVVAIDTAQYPTPAARPANSVMACDKIAQNFDIRPGAWRDGLERTLQSIYG